MFDDTILLCALYNLSKRYKMLYINLDRLLKLRDVRKGRSYLVNNGLSDSEARHLLSGKAKSVKFDMLCRLCGIFNCTLDELFDWKGETGHPLAVMRKNEVTEIANLLEGKSPKELEEMLKRLRDEL